MGREDAHTGTGGGVREAALAAVGIARQHGVPCTAAAVLHARENTMVHLRPHPVVARITGAVTSFRKDAGVANLRRELAVAGELADRGAAVCAPSALLPAGPHRRSGLAVSFWAWVDHHRDRPLDAVNIGASLRTLHRHLGECAAPLPFLAPVDELPDVLELLRAAGVMDVSDLDELAEDIADAQAHMPAVGQPLHGDAHTGNLLRTPQGVLWNDFEDACLGPREWDVACLLASSTVFGSNPEFVDEVSRGYGPWDEQLLSFCLRLRAAQLVVRNAVNAQRFPRLGGYAQHVHLRRRAWIDGMDR